MNDHQLHPQNSNIFHIIILVLLVILLVKSWSSPSSFVVEVPQKDAYQAVFLNNNQVYFGKLMLLKDQYVLRDIYYIKSFQTPPTDKQDEPGLETKLLKFGDEVHGPQDAIYMQPEHVLFWENLKSDSKIVKAIDQFKDQEKKKLEEVNIKEKPQE